MNHNPSTIPLSSPHEPSTINHSPLPPIHQFVAGFALGDAISNQAIAMQDVFRSWGHDSVVFTEPGRISRELRSRSGNMSQYAASAAQDDIVILHLSIGSRVNTVFADLPCRKAIQYHNVTPAHYFDMVNKRTAAVLAEGRKQVAHLAGVAEVNMAVSRFNADELAKLGYKNVRVLPLILDHNRLKGSSDPVILKTFDDGKTNILFVGRCAPNKRIQDLLDFFHHFHRHVDPNSRLIHVGSAAGALPYYATLLARARHLGIKPAVHFTGMVGQAQLNAFYECADAFVCMSEHEGFCIPVFEAMTHDVPVLAYAAAAVPETMAGAGILFREKDHAAIAELTGKVVQDHGFRAALIRGQRERLARHTERDLGAELKEHLEPLLEK